MTHGCPEAVVFTHEHIDVAAKYGEVTLTGTVFYRDERALAGTTAWAGPRRDLWLQPDPCRLTYGAPDNLIA